MDRRELLKLGALAGVGGLTSAVGEGCLLPSLLSDTDPSAPPDMDAYLATIDRGIERIEARDPRAEGLGNADRDSERDQLCRKSMKALFLTAMFSDLPPEGQAHPGMQDRMWKAVPDINEAVFGTVDLLRRQTPEQLGELQTKLRGATNPGMLLADRVDRGASSCGLNGRRRVQTRTMFAHVDGRLRKQPPSLLVDEILTKVDKLCEHSATVAGFRQELGKRIGETALREHERKMAEYERRRGLAGSPPVDAAKQPVDPVPSGHHSPNQPPPPVGTVVPSAAATPEPPAAEPEETPGDKVFTDGLIVLGVAAGVSVLGAALIPANILASAILWTVGGILLLAGLITMIVGAAMD